MAGPALCTVWHPEASGALVKPLVRGKVLEITAATAEEAMKQLPPDIHTPPREIIRVVLLRASREVAEALRDRGWHSGHWRDHVTGQDNGVRRLFASTTDRVARGVGLKKIVRVLHDEARQVPDGIATLWHDEISADMIEGEGIQVIEIQADSALEAIARLKELSDEQSR